MTDQTTQAAIRSLLRDELRDVIVTAAGPSRCHLVGGAVRDRLVFGRDTRDWDLTVRDHGETVANRLARRLDGRVVHLGGERFAAYRVICPSRVLDLWDRRGMPMEVELCRRDLTLNSIAIDLVTGEVLDPTRGLADLAAHTLRCNAPERFSEDPVRVLRLLRFAVQLPQFEIEPQTLRSAHEAAAGIDDVAPERVREELDKALGRLPVSGLGMLLPALGLFPRLWAPGTTDSQWPGLASTVGAADEDLESTLDEIGAQVTPAALVAFHHALLLTACEEQTDDALSSGAPLDLLAGLLSRRHVSRAIADLIRSLLPAAGLPRDDDSRRLFVHRFAERWPMAAALAASRDRSLSTDGRAALLTDLAALGKTESQRLQNLEILLDGEDLQRQFDLDAGPRIGELLHSLERAQVVGEVATEQEAREWIERELRTERRPT